MANPVTTTDILLQEVAGLLTEIRDLLRERPATASQPAAKKTAKKATAAKAPAAAHGKAK